jgi:peptidoglycan hydrolase CwlO-like protein
MNRKAKNGFRITISAISALMLVTAAFPQVAYGFTVSPSTSSGSSSGTKSGSGSSSGSTNNSGKNANTEKLNNLKNNYEQLEKEKKAIEAKLKDIKNEKSQTIAERNSISRQIDISNEQLALLKDKIKLITMK